MASSINPESQGFKADDLEDQESKLGPNHFQSRDYLFKEKILSIIKETESQKRPFSQEFLNKIEILKSELSGEASPDSTLSQNNKIYESIFNTSESVKEKIISKTQEISDHIISLQSCQAREAENIVNKLELNLSDLIESIRESKITPPVRGKSILESIQRYPNFLVNDLKNNEQLSADHFLMVHCSSYPLEYNQENDQLLIQPSAASHPESGRYTVHAAINHPVYSHSKGDWDSSSFVYLMPYSEMLQKNGYPLEVSYVDTFWFDQVAIPESSVILCSPDSPLLNIPQNKKDSYKVIIVDNPRKWAEKIINQMGYDVFRGIGTPVSDKGKNIRTVGNPDSYGKQISKVFPQRFKGFASDTHQDSPFKFLERESSEMLLAIHAWENKKEKNIHSILKDFIDFASSLNGRVLDCYGAETKLKVIQKYSQKFFTPFFDFICQDDIYNYLEKAKKFELSEEDLTYIGYSESDFKDRRRHYDEDNNAVPKIQKEIWDMICIIKKMINQNPQLFQVIKPDSLSLFQSL